MQVISARALTRRMKKESTKSAVVVEFSRTRKRYERQGILVEKESLRKVRQELMIEDNDDYSELWASDATY